MGKRMQEELTMSSEEVEEMEKFRITREGLIQALNENVDFRADLYADWIQQIIEKFLEGKHDDLKEFIEHIHVIRMQLPEYWHHQG